MKQFLASSLLLVCCAFVSARSTSGGASAVDSAKVIRICTPARGQLLQPPPLYVVVSKNQEFILSKDFTFYSIDAKTIESIDVLKDAATLAKYGEPARYGVIRITINDKKAPQMYKYLKKNAGKA